MIRRLPLIPTILDAFAVAAMIGLGIWQIGRAGDKRELLARHEAALGQPPIAFPTGPIGEPLPLYRKATGYCLQPVGKRVVAGRNRAGETGYVHIVTCRTGAEGPGMAVQVGWSKDPRAEARWGGGPVTGTIVPDSKYRMRLVADGAAAGLQPSAVPTPTTSIPPAQHWAYAFTWFGLAAAALVVYVFAARKRLARSEGEPRP